MIRFIALVLALWKLLRRLTFRGAICTQSRSTLTWFFDPRVCEQLDVLQVSGNRDDRETVDVGLISTMQITSRLSLAGNCVGHQRA